MKMRTCQYLVRGLYGEVLPSTSFEADVPEVTPKMRATSEKEIQKEESKKRKAEKKVPAEAPDVLPLTGTDWDKFNGLPFDELMEASLADLRKYALYNCRIAGASKLHGGKKALVRLILKTCKQSQKKQHLKEAKEAIAKGRAIAPKGLKIPLRGTEWDKLNRMNSLQLLQESLDSLRKYARHNCLIVGASKISGGKIRLIKIIMEARGDK